MEKAFIFNCYMTQKLNYTPSKISRSNVLEVCISESSLYPAKSHLQTKRSRFLNKSFFRIQKSILSITVGKQNNVLQKRVANLLHKCA